MPGSRQPGRAGKKRQAKVEDGSVPIGAQVYVAALNIAMHDTEFVRCLQPLRNLETDIHCLPYFQPYFLLSFPRCCRP